jgi:hypothetical protein
MIFVMIIVGSLFYRNYQLSLVAKSYANYTSNSVAGFEGDIALTTSPNAVDVIHFITKYSYLASSGETDSAFTLLNSLNYNQVSYQPFRELLYLYDNNREGSSDTQTPPIFTAESKFIKAINLIQAGDLNSAYSYLNEISAESNQSELLQKKTDELKKIIRFKINESKS